MIDRALARLLGIAAAGALVLFVGVSVVRAGLAPELRIDTPPDGAVVHRPVVTLRGSAKGAREVRVNNQLLALTKDTNAFEEMIPLSPGTNLLYITAKKRHSRTASATRRVIYLVASSTPTP